MTAMHTGVLALHSLLRWLVIVAGLVAVFRGVTGWQTRRGWTASDGVWGLWFTIALDIQLLLGVVLYAVTSPVTRVALQDMGAAMANPVLRFWAVEHAFGMVVALALAHIGRVRIRKASGDAQRHRTAAIFFTLALLAVLISIPWPGTLNARPLLRLP